MFGRRLRMWLVVGVVFAGEGSRTWVMAWAPDKTSYLFPKAQDLDQEEWSLGPRMAGLVLWDTKWGGGAVTSYTGGTQASNLYPEMPKLEETSLAQVWWGKFVRAKIKDVVGGWGPFICLRSHLYLLREARYFTSPPSSPRVSAMPRGFRFLPGVLDLNQPNWHPGSGSPAGVLARITTWRERRWREKKQCRERR